MNVVWVVLFGVDSEGGWVEGVAATAEAGMALAERELPPRAVTPIEWREAKPGAKWFARPELAGFDFVEVTRWEVTERKVEP